MDCVPALRMPITIVQLVLELLLLSFAGPMLLLGRLVPEPKPPLPETRVVIVFTWLYRVPLHLFWAQYLDRIGIRTAILFIPLRKVALDESVDVLRDYLRDHDLRDVVLVGVSTGALTCLLSLQEPDGWSRVRRFVAVAGPFGGTPLAVLAPFAHVRDLIPGRFMRRLGGKPLQHAERITCISARFDELIPRRSSCLPGTHCEVVNVAGHNNLHALTRATYDRIARLAR